MIADLPPELQARAARLRERLDARVAAAAAGAGAGAGGEDGDEPIGGAALEEMMRAMAGGGGLFGGRAGRPQMVLAPRAHFPHPLEDDEEAGEDGAMAGGEGDFRMRLVYDDVTHEPRLEYRGARGGGGRAARAAAAAARAVAAAAAEPEPDPSAEFDEEGLLAVLRLLRLQHWGVRSRLHRVLAGAAAARRPRAALLRLLLAILRAPLTSDELPSPAHAAAEGGSSGAAVDEEEAEAARADAAAVEALGLGRRHEGGGAVPLPVSRRALEALHSLCK
jgi:hypothetical protein